MNVHKIYNSFSVNHNKFLQNKVFYSEIDSAHAKRKRYNKKL